MNDLADKIVLVTGASRGIGAVTAAAFAGRGALVFANYPESDAATHRLAIKAWREEADIESDRVVPIVADVADVQQVKVMFEAVRDRAGALDVLVNNAGINRDRTVMKLTDEEWHQVMVVNLFGTFHCCRAAIRLLREGGRIINIASVLAHTGGFGTANYAASKAGVIGLSKTLALELAKRRITVNAVCPGYIDTDMTRSIPPDVLANLLARVPLGRLGTPEEVAACILFLASAKAGYITGHCLHVNGGLYMGG